MRNLGGKNTLGIHRLRYEYNKMVELQEVDGGSMD